jgi:hypothetical protein
MSYRCPSSVLVATQEFYQIPGAVVHPAVVFRCCWWVEFTRILERPTAVGDSTNNNNNSFFFFFKFSLLVLLLRRKYFFSNSK